LLSFKLEKQYCWDDQTCLLMCLRVLNIGGVR